MRVVLALMAGLYITTLLKGGPAIWTTFMLIVVAGWSIWLHGPRTKEQIKKSSKIIFITGVVSLLLCVIAFPTVQQ